jgi:hypothetical protein
MSLVGKIPKMHLIGHCRVISAKADSTLSCAVAYGMNNLSEEA